MALNYHFFNNDTAFLVMTTGVIEEGEFYIYDIVNFKEKVFFNPLIKSSGRINQIQLIKIAKENKFNLDLYFNEYFLKILYQIIN